MYYLISGNLPETREIVIDGIPVFINLIKHEKYFHCIYHFESKYSDVIINQYFEKLMNSDKYILSKELLI